MASPILNFVNLQGRVVHATYQHMPANSKIVLIDKISGKAMPAPVAVARASDSQIAVTIKLPATVKAGTYHLKAQNLAGGYLAQSVDFTVA